MFVNNSTPPLLLRGSAHSPSPSHYLSHSLAHPLTISFPLLSLLPSLSLFFHDAGDAFVSVFLLTYNLFILFSFLFRLLYPERKTRWTAAATRGKGA